MGELFVYLKREIIEKCLIFVKMYLINENWNVSIYNLKEFKSFYLV